MPAFHRLLEGLAYRLLAGDPQREITGIAYDSRRIKPGYLFVCLRGFQTDGHLYLAEAAGRGAVAALVERPVDLPLDITMALTQDGRAALAQVAANFYGYPSQSLRLIGVTGTNGKTTVTHLIEAVLRGGGRHVGLIGTVGSRLGEREWPGERTTPESLDLQFLLRDMQEAGASDVVMEVSSHALALKRVAGVEYNAAVFTNLTQDHLDFHQNLQDYLESKAMLFQGLGKGSKRNNCYAVLNADDPASRRLRVVTGVEIFTYGLQEGAEVRARNIDIKPGGSSLEVFHPGGSFPLKLKLTGIFNVYNVLAACVVGLREGLEALSLRESLEGVSGVPGRFEAVSGGGDFTVIVDYAHTPDGLENVLQTARQVAKGRLIVVFGCGGDRDRQKRPLMGEVAARLGDLVIITSDNPRREDPLAIIEEILPGLAGLPRDRYIVEPDRRKAIEQAIEMARPDDLILLAGKGHETYQIIGSEDFPFDDRQVAREVLTNRRG